MKYKITNNLKFLTSIVTIFLVLFTGCYQSDNTLPVAQSSVSQARIAASAFALGADVSWITEQEAAGKLFYNSAGVATEGMALLKQLGSNTIRLRVWVNPANSFNAVADVITKAKRAKNLGMRIMIDFHYSDTWADPTWQAKPAAWANLSFTKLKTAVTSHTKSVLTQLKAAGITPEWVQVGNETSDGMLWPTGRATTNMANFAALITTGYNAVKAVFPYAKVIVHLNNGHENNMYRWMFDGLKANNAKYDVIGMSLYPSYASYNWTTVNNNCVINMNDMISRYGKEVMIVEVGMPWDNPDCFAFLTDLIAKCKAIPNAKSLGVLYWEPQCYANWQGYSLGAFDSSGKPTRALDAFR